MKSNPSLRLAAALLAALVFGGVAAPSQLGPTSSSRTLVVAIEVDRGGARLIGFTVKDRRFVARDEGSPEADPRDTTRIEVALLGPAGARFTQHVAMDGLCLAHDPDTPADVPHRPRTMRFARAHCTLGLNA